LITGADLRLLLIIRRVTASWKPLRPDFLKVNHENLL
jgi:hypothetical protein